MPEFTPNGKLALRAGLVAAMAALVALAWWVFALLGQDYWAFWLKTGPIIGLASAAFAWSWGDVDRNVDLISANPALYVGAAFFLPAPAADAFGGHIGQGTRSADVPILDRLIGTPFLLVYIAAAIAWLLLVAPARYFAFLITGAPARIMMASRYRVFARIERTTGRFEHVGANDLDPADYPEEQGWWDASMRGHPVTITNAFTAALLFTIDIFLA